MEDSRITEKDLLDRGYTPTEKGKKYAKKINGKDVELTRNGKGVLPKVKHNNSKGKHTLKGTTHYRQVDDPENLDEIEKEIKSELQKTKN